MSERKYRQHGYQDSAKPSRADGGGAPRPPAEPHDPRIPRDPRAANVPGFRDVVRCARCGALEAAAIGPDSACRTCGSALHACAQCASFDPGAVFECTQRITARISPKDARNTCKFFAARVQVERETGSTPLNRHSAGVRKAFDDLFNI